MNLKLVHFSERLLDDYFNLIQKGKVRMPELRNSSKRGARTANFLQTEDN